MARFLITGFVLLCSGLSFGANLQTVYFGAGRSFSLRPPKDTGKITSIVWKHNGDFAAEWSEGEADSTYYRNFKTHAHLNTITGVLEIRDSTKDESGDYTVEINNDLKPDGYKAELIEEVSEPNVWPKTVTTEGQQTLSCEGSTDKAGPVTFEWDVGEEGTWVQLDQEITIKDNETTRLIETFSCKIRNALGEKESKPIANPFHPKKEPDRSGLWALLFPIGLICICIGLGIFAYIKRESLKPYIPCLANENRAAVSNNTETHSLKNDGEAGGSSGGPCPAGDPSA